ncbi:MAG: condensation domain-containing protein, partial [Gloeotrichia echinulata HAB0833]
MNLVEFLQELASQNVELWKDGEQLRYFAPQDVLTPTFLKKLKEHKTEILAFLQDNGNISRFYPLSHGQQGLWFLYQLAPESAAYNVAFTTHIHSDLNVPALQRAFQSLITRHATLRTTFLQNGNKPIQEIKAYQEVCFEEIDASTWNQDQLIKKVIEVYQRPFNLETGPVVRVSLFTKSAHYHTLVLAIHHIAVDGLSFGILLDELRLFYQAENEGLEVSLPPISWQYTNYVQWQAKMLASSTGEKLWDYWQKKLSGELPVLNLPTDNSGSQIYQDEGASYTFEINKELASQLTGLAMSEGATLYMILLAAFQILLHKYTGQEDIIVGSPSSCRNQAELTRTVGFFLNMLALRVNLSGNPIFQEFLSQVRQTVLEAISYQDYPSPLLVEKLQLHRDPTLKPLFRVAFNLVKVSQIGEILDLLNPSQVNTRVNWGGLLLEPFQIPQEEGQNDLILNLLETSDSLIGTIKYSKNLFNQTTITRLIDNFHTLLAGIVANPQQRISELPL